MRVGDNNVVILLAFLGILQIGFCGDFGANQCLVSSDCLRCISASSSEVETCFKLRWLAMESTNHPAEREQYCNGQCPIILATTYNYCEDTSSITRIFEECDSYSVEPTGAGDFSNTISSCAEGSSCTRCFERINNDVLRCEQHQLLTIYANDTLSYKNSFCAGDCPLTLTTSDWYCELGLPGTFTQCRKNSNGRFCSEVFDELRPDNDVLECENSGTCSSNACVTAIRKYGCCLEDRSFFASRCNLDECTIETGGSPAHTATPLIVLVLLLSSIVMR